MNEFRGKVAVVTGAASGIGRALAERCAQEGMKVVLAGINASTLAEVEQALKAGGAEVLAVQTDVSKAEQVEALAQKSFEAFGQVHLLINNAGVGVDDTNIAWESSLADWQWTLGVNLWGVIHGLHYFVPRMLEQDEESYIVNNASGGGLFTDANNSPYIVSKHAVVALSETLYYGLKERGAKVKVSALFAGLVNTRMTDSERNRPAELQNPERLRTPQELALKEEWVKNVRAAKAPQEVAEKVFQAIREERFYIFLTGPQVTARIKMRMEDIIQGRNPGSTSG
jgi:NAD(P)-dependent dehydrogenase (short-subunit alcohol dehydrogenase family)